VAAARGLAETFHSDHGKKGTKMVKRATKKAEGLPADTLGRDLGVTFVEMLVAIVLLGIGVVGTLTAVRASVMGSRIERDHAMAHQWLQSASEVVRDTPRLGCDAMAEAAIRNSYQATIRTNAPAPDGWSDATLIDIIPPIRFWDGQQYLDPPACYENEERYLQLIQLQVSNPDGDIIETVEVVKHD
jgi:hypothetical protein